MRIKCSTVNTSFEYDSPAHFLQSQWQTKEKSIAYLIYRWIVACFFVFSVVCSLVTSILRGQLHVYCIYLTHWNLVFTMISMVWSAYLVTLHHMDKLQVSGKMTKALKLSWFLSTTSNLYAFLISTIYWTVLYKTEVNYIDFNNIIVHATNSLVVLINILLVKQPERFGLFLYPLTNGFAFLFFSWLYPFLGGVNRRGQPYIYPILNWKQSPDMALISGTFVMIAGAIVHFLIFMIQKARANIHKKFFSKMNEKADAFILTC